tara:strand:+ start:14340 stop:14561 length:222 start_codon:yes stop_codon:yes gene_type:complete
MTVTANYLSHLKRGPQNKDNRWIVKRDTEGLIKEVKLLFNPKEYRSLKNAKPILTRDKLIKILENDKKEREAK